jgi:hypothetical protein
LLARNQQLAERPLLPACLRLQSLMEHQEVQAYMVEPPLVGHASGPSTVDYTAQHLNMTLRERGWIAAYVGRHHRRMLLQHAHLQ